MFPTSGEISSIMRHLRGVELESELRALRPDLSDAIRARPNGNVTIDLPATRVDASPKVVVGRMADLHWLIAAGRPTTIEMSTWHRDTSISTICSATWAIYDAARHGLERPTPWRWDEAEVTPIVQAADLLERNGFSVTAVAANNRRVPNEFGDFRDSRTVPRDFGDALRIDLDWGSATLALKSTLGWVLDVSDHLITRRMPLGHHLPDGEPQGFWVQSDNVECVVAAAVSTLRKGRWHSLEGHIDGTDVPYFDDSKKTSFVVNWWLTELGFASSSASEADLHIKVWSKDSPVSQSDVKGAYADAAVSGRSLIAVSTSRFSRTASSWLALARLPAFIADLEHLKLFAANDVGAAHIPALI